MPPLQKILALSPLCLVGLLSSCTALPLTPAAGILEQSPLDAARAKRAATTLSITSEDASSTCAAVPVTERVAVTALHCLRNACGQGPRDGAREDCSVRYTTARGETGRAELAAQSPGDDLALLELTRALPDVAKLRCDDPLPGEAMYSVGHPAGRSFIGSAGTVERAPVELTWNDGTFTRVMVANMSLTPGFSGAGLFDSAEKLVGVVIARFSPTTQPKALTAAVHSERVGALLDSYCRERGYERCPSFACASSQGASPGIS
jgi:hypothetical protein